MEKKKNNFSKLLALWSLLCKFIWIVAAANAYF